MALLKVRHWQRIGNGCTIVDDILKPAASELRRIWDDQADFNRLFRDPSTFGFEQRTTETKELTLHLFSECDELLRASGAWKLHRRTEALENRRAVGYELADIFKYLMSIAQVQGFTVEDFVQFYWEKSMIVRQRYAQEHVQSLDNPAVVIDIDNVLADYIRSFVTWLANNNYIRHDLCASFVESPRYVDARAIGMLPNHYDEAKHLFRVSGEHANLSMMMNAGWFLQKLLEDQPARSIILLTSRPIERYPNLYGETLRWLTTWGLPYHFVWWAGDKGEAIRTSQIANKVEFAVDDEWQYVEQFARVGVKTYWLNYTGHYDSRQEMMMQYMTNIRMVRSLDEIVKAEEGHERNTEV